MADAMSYCHPIILALHVVRKERQMSQTRLAAEMGYHPNTIMNWERGRQSPTLHALVDWAAALELDLAIELEKRPK